MAQRLKASKKVPFGKSLIDPIKGPHCIDLFGKLPEGDELTRLTLWELARECPHVVDGFRALREHLCRGLKIHDKAKLARSMIHLLPRSVTKGSSRLSPSIEERRALVQLFSLPNQSFVEVWVRLFEQVDTSLQRFDWSFLCSPGFPDEPWLADPNCVFKSSGELYRSSVFSGGPPQTHVRHGKKTRPKAIRSLPKLYSAAGTIKGAQEYNSVGDIEKCVLELEEVAKSLRCSKFHLLLIPDAYFTSRDPEDVAQSFRKWCHLQSRRRLIPHDVFAGAFSRDNCVDYVRALAARRFFQAITPEDRREALRCIVLTKTDAHREARYYLCSPSATAAAARVDGLLQKIFSAPKRV